MTTQKHDTPPLFAWIDVPASLGLLSRLPIRVDIAAASARGPHSAWAYPLAGLVIAFCALALTSVALWFGLPAPLAAALFLAAQITLTGAMHEDGLADSFDGLWGGWTRDKRLDIMKDSHIGTYGVLSLGVSMLARWSALTLILSADAWAALLAVAALSRAAMPCVMAVLPHARSNGLSHHVGRPLPITALIGAALAALFALIMPDTPALLLILTVIATTILWAKIAQSKIGGQTGDILGATQQLTEVTALMVLAASLA